MGQYHNKSGDRRRVVVTGLGPVSAFGLGIDPLWEAMCAGTSGIRAIESFDASGFDCPFGASLSRELFDVRKAVPKTYRKATKVMARDIELAVGAAAWTPRKDRMAHLVSMLLGLVSQFLSKEASRKW